MQRHWGTEKQNWLVKIFLVEHLKWRFFTGHVVVKKLLVASCLLDPEIVPEITACNGSISTFHPASLTSTLFAIKYPMTFSIGTRMCRAVSMIPHDNCNELQISNKFNLWENRDKNEFLIKISFIFSHRLMPKILLWDCWWRFFQKLKLKKIL